MQNKDDLTYHLTAHLRVNAIYWGVTALCIMKHKDALHREEMVDFVMSCWDDEAGKYGSCSTEVVSQDMYRRIRGTPGTRCAHTRHTQRNTDSYYPRCTG